MLHVSTKCFAWWKQITKIAMEYNTWNQKWNWTLTWCCFSHMTTQSKEAGIKTLVMLDEQGGKSVSGTDQGRSVPCTLLPLFPWFLSSLFFVIVGKLVILLFVLSWLQYPKLAYPILLQPAWSCSLVWIASHFLFWVDWCDVYVHFDVVVVVVFSFSWVQWNLVVDCLFVDILSSFLCIYIYIATCKYQATLNELAEKENSETYKTSKDFFKDRLSRWQTGSSYCKMSCFTIGFTLMCSCYYKCESVTSVDDKLYW